MASGTIFQRGYRVVGIDAAERYLGQARKAA